MNTFSRFCSIARYKLSDPLLAARTFFVFSVLLVGSLFGIQWRDQRAQATPPYHKCDEGAWSAGTFDVNTGRCVYLKAPDTWHLVTQHVQCVFAFQQDPTGGSALPLTGEWCSPWATAEDKRTSGNQAHFVGVTDP